MPYTCSNKKRYPSQRKAAEAMNIIKHNSPRSIIPRRAYHCDECGDWHLTSISQRQKSIFKNKITKPKTNE